MTKVIRIKYERWNPKRQAGYVNFRGTPKKRKIIRIKFGRRT